ncbi:hypothetical protein SAMN05421796_11256 [Chryseobacterium piscicola]|jgi:hypothetical protein|uniref:Uncharacterized protein n=1 Tax=Chryseobacterium piscicola TaxID=551459 RepID=A0A1N7PAM0_9FLAO|nr:DUF5606 domain-containing protein [Chryseobacterium piscicola]PQA95378.1 hypothetical protein B0A70_06100 [Chryseobacterium piscicola]SIT07685.1 hypothetical protein SAMN05421796_11256 [Chryseobacterium piscicola]
MQLEKIISISGKPGLFKLVSQLRNGFIIEDVTTKKKVSIGNSSQVSLLDNIAMFTFDKEVPLFEVFENIAKNYDYKETISHKSSEEELKDFMNASLPNYDTDRVYVSDIKKLAQWYNTLHKAGYITPESFVKAEPETLEGEAAEEINVEKEAPKKAPKAEKPATPKVKASTGAKAATKSTHRKMG